MIVFFVFIGKYEVFFSIIDCWKIRGVLSVLVVGWKKRTAISQNTSGGCPCMMTVIYMRAVIYGSIRIVRYVQKVNINVSY